MPYLVRNTGPRTRGFDGGRITWEPSEERTISSADYAFLAERGSFMKSVESGEFEVRLVEGAEPANMPARAVGRSRFLSKEDRQRRALLKKAAIDSKKQGAPQLPLPSNVTSTPPVMPDETEEDGEDEAEESPAPVKPARPVKPAARAPKAPTPPKAS